MAIKTIDFIAIETSDELTRTKEIYVLLDVLLFSIAEYFYELCRILASP